MSIQKFVKMFDIDVGDDLPASLEYDHDYFLKKRYLVQGLQGLS